MRAGQGLSPEPGRGQGALRPRMLVGWRRAAEGRGLQSGATPPLLRCPALERACSPTAPLPAGPTSLALPLSSDDSDTRWALVTASPAPAASQCRPALTSSSGRRPPPPRTDTGPHGRCCHRTPGWGPSEDAPAGSWLRDRTACSTVPEDNSPLLPQMQRRRRLGCCFSRLFTMSRRPEPSSSAPAPLVDSASSGPRNLAQNDGGNPGEQTLKYTYIIILVAS
ncbi:uncharacterized protein [Manis javanica]|uniref:uncharacterized protein isoform X2 n=1 Tax=Manis javanica TaxID=9974 RepID=UPI003C6DB055